MKRDMERVGCVSECVRFKVQDESTVEIRNDINKCPSCFSARGLNLSNWGEPADCSNARRPNPSNWGRLASRNTRETSRHLMNNLRHSRRNLCNHPHHRRPNHRRPNLSNHPHNLHPESAAVQRSRLTKALYSIRSSLTTLPWPTPWPPPSWTNGGKYRRRKRPITENKFGSS